MRIPRSFDGARPYLEHSWRIFVEVGALPCRRPQGELHEVHDGE